MATIQEQLDSFNRFVAERTTTEVDEYTIDQLYDLWRINNPTDAEHAENVAAVKASLEDLANGERGRPASEVSDDIRKELGLSKQ